MTEPTFPLALLAAALVLASVAYSLRPSRRRLKVRPTPAPRPAWSAESVLALVRAVPFDRRSPREQKEIVDRLRAVDLGPVSMREHGQINLVLGEIALLAGDRDQARFRFRVALRWDPRLPIRRTLERLENPTPLSFTSRRAA
jgi:hypothetical protein